MKKMSRVFILLGMLLILTALVSGIGNVFAAEGQETCPKDGDWIKFDNLSGMQVELGAPEGMLIVEICYKAATYVVYEEVLPPAQSVVITSTVGHELSHASIRVIDLYYTPTNTPFTPPTETPTFTPEVTPTSTVGISPTPSDPPYPTPSDPTVVPTLPKPPVEKTPHLLPQTGAENRTSDLFLFGWIVLMLAGFGLSALGIIVNRRK